MKHLLLALAASLLFSGCVYKSFDNGAYNNGDDTTYFILFGGSADGCPKKAP
jgi:hypothetical protein